MDRLHIFKEVFMSIFAIVVVTIGICMVAALIFHSVPPENRDIINVSLGTVLAMCLSVVQYYFGSSKSSADKSDTIKTLTTSDSPPTKPAGT